MGFICVVKNEETDVTKLKKEVWPNAYTNEDDSNEPEKLTNGAQVVVAPNTVAIQTKDGKFADIITTPGGYLYHEKAPVNEHLEEYDSFMQGMAELFMQKAGMKATGLAFIETDRQVSSPEELHAWFMQFAQPEEPEPESAPTPTVAKQSVTQAAPASTPQPSQDTSWECPSCGTRNQFFFCKNCGKAKPEENIQSIKSRTNQCPGSGKVL